MNKLGLVRFRSRQSDVFVCALVVCRVAKVVAPKKAALKQAEAEYATLMEGLAAKKAELAAVVAALDALNAKLAAMQVRGAWCRIMQSSNLHSNGIWPLHFCAEAEATGMFYRQAALPGRMCMSLCGCFQD